MEIKIERVTIQDVAALQKISRQTFFETFSTVNTAENMAKYLDENFSIQKLTGELANPSSAFYFAIQHQEILGYLKLNFGPSQTEIKDETAVEIERIYVLQAHQGKKVGQLLYEKSIEISHSKNARYIWLGVWEENNKAINFYKKNGFVAFSKHVFTLGDDEQTDIMMRKMLHA